jgi:F-type H+-transporting ATPase subunit c
MKRFVSPVFAFFGTFLMTALAFASDGAATGGDSSNYGWFAIAAAIAIGLPALGGALGQGKAASAALEGIARNPGASGKIFVPMILGMALIESLVLFGLLMAFVLSGNIK